MYILKNLSVPINDKVELSEAVSAKLKITPEQFTIDRVIRKSLDARTKNNLKFIYTLQITPAKKVLHNDLIKISPLPELKIRQVKLCDKKPFIVGAGPSGLFSALALTEKGFQPFIIEQGSCLELRKKQVSDFWNKSILNSESNVQFGEGGAGAFSDGKLTSRTRNNYTDKVFKYLIKFGAPEEISYEALPHIGTDKLTEVIGNIRKYLENAGCTFLFNHKLEDIEIKKNRVSRIKINGQNYSPEILIIGPGNSSRNTFKMLSQKIPLERKPFAVGIRIEHPQNFLNQALYGKNSDINLTGPAVYKLTYKHNSRGVYSFCMCPGGLVICGSSDKGQVVTNGMSYHKRNKKFGNSAIVASVSPNDYGNGLFDGIKFQKNLEEKCFNENTPYFAPAQKTSDYIGNRKNNNIEITSFLPGVYSYNIQKIFPQFLNKALISSLIHFNKIIPGFISEGTVFAPETRTSCPIRILRNTDYFFSLGAENLFPIGEGSGYAGGIISSASDGFRTGSMFI